MSGKRAKKERRMPHDEGQLRKYMNDHKHDRDKCMIIAHKRMLEKKMAAMKERLNIIEPFQDPEVVVRPNTPKKILSYPGAKGTRAAHETIDMDEAAAQICKERFIEHQREAQKENSNG